MVGRTAFSIVTSSGRLLHRFEFPFTSKSLRYMKSLFLAPLFNLEFVPFGHDRIHISWEFLEAATA